MIPLNLILVTTILSTMKLCIGTDLLQVVFLQNELRPYHVTKMATYTRDGSQIPLAPPQKVLI